MAAVASFWSRSADHRLRHRRTAGDAVPGEPPWITRFNVNYHLGVDGISVVRAAHRLHHRHRRHRRLGGDHEARRQYMGAFLILSGLMVGVFTALDGLLFYVFFEATLIPMYIIIGVWGPNRVYAAFKFFLYTLLGSLLMLVALIYLYIKSGGSFDILLPGNKLPLPAKACAGAAVLRLLRGLLGQGADVAGAHLAARRPRRSADRRFGGAGGHHAEAGRLRLPCASLPIAPGRQPRVGLVHHRAEPDRGDLHRAGGWCSRT